MGEHSSSDTIPLGRYLWERIHQVGVNHIFGVPGDFNLTLLDHIYSVPGLSWTGNTNELNAAYAADGYSRARGGGAACVVTTHGVGELSAMNAIAGSMCEHVKVIHVVGQTSRSMQSRHMMIHHSIGDKPDHQVYNKASTNFRVAAAELQSEEGAPEEIDRVLRECFRKSGPVYVFVPIDIVDLPVPAQALQTPLDLRPEIDEKAVEEAAQQVIEVLSASKSPGVFVDCLVHRYQAVADARALLDKLALPIYTSNMGKGIIDETNQYYAGLYNGEPSGPGVEAAFKKHDILLILGALPSDTNSGGFSRHTPTDISININPQNVDIQGSKTYLKAPLQAVIRKLAELASSASLPKVANPRNEYPPRPIEDDSESKLITQSWVWHRLASWMQPYDVALGETGTAAFGIPDATFPANVSWHTQTYYGSIGWATPASLGVDLALSDLAAHHGKPRGRTLLFTGDGSLMLTAQEVGNMVKLNLQPILFVINNAGYTIERIIHGARQSYNDIVPFNYQHMLSFLGMDSERAMKHFHRAETKAELEEILMKEELKHPTGVHVVEIVMDMMDVPWRLATAVAMRGPEAIKEMKEAGFRVREPKTKKGFWS